MQICWLGGRIKSALQSTVVAYQELFYKLVLPSCPLDRLPSVFMVSHLTYSLPFFVDGLVKVYDARAERIDLYLRGIVLFCQIAVLCIMSNFGSAQWLLFRSCSARRRGCLPFERALRSIEVSAAPALIPAAGAPVEFKDRGRFLRGIMFVVQ
jgi:hypothetical protein